MTDVIETIGSGKDYANVLEWLTAHGSDDPVVDETRYIGWVYPGTHSDDTAHVPQLAASKTSTEYYRWLRAAPGFEYDNTTDTGVYIKTTTGGAVLRILEENFRVTGIGMENARVTGVTVPPLNRCIRVDRQCIVESCYLLVSQGWNDLNACIDVTAALGSGKTCYIVSTICEGMNGRAFTGARIGISTFLASAGAEVHIYNCTVWGIQKLSVGAPFPWLGIGIIFGNANNEAVIHNNAVFESRNFDLFQNTVAKEIDNNIWGDGSVVTTGNNNIDDGVYTSELVDAPDDFRLKVDGQSVDSGKNLNAVWPVSLTYDHTQETLHRPIYERGAFAIPPLDRGGGERLGVASLGVEAASAATVGPQALQAAPLGVEAAVSGSLGVEALEVARLGVEALDAAEVLTASLDAAAPRSEAQGAATLGLHALGAGTLGVEALSWAGPSVVAQDAATLGVEALGTPE